MDRQSEFLPKSLCDYDWQRRAGGDAKSELRQWWGIFYFAKSLIENGGTGKNGRMCFRKIAEDCARSAVLTQHHRHAAGDQRREQVAEAVGVRNRNDAEVKVDFGNSHRLADLVAIGQELFALKSNCARRRGRAGSEFEK